jgi:putative DNA primase/helicase
MRFADFAAAHGLILNDVRRGAIFRCPTEEKPKKKNGAYFWDGERGWVCNWGKDGEIHWFNEGGARAWTDAEKAAWRARRQSAEQERYRRWREAARRAENEIVQATLSKHPYLAAKGFPDGLALVSGAHLLVPIRSLSGQVMSVQRITLEENEWKKKMLPGGRTKGGVFRLGDRGRMFLCEGYATGLSIKSALEATGIRASVVVCFSAGNLIEVSRFVNPKAVVCADNDVSGTGQQAAMATGLPWIMPDEAGQDFNDLHQLAGIVAVVKKLREVMMT